MQFPYIEKLKINVFISSLLVIILLMSCEQTDDSIAYEALTLAIENSLAYNSFYHHRTSAEIITVPISKQIIDSTIHYKQSLENLTEEEANQLRKKNYAEYITGNKSTFLLYVNADYADNRCAIYFDELITNFDDDFTDDSLYGFTDHVAFTLSGYTRIFDSVFTEGVSVGYLHFDNYRKKDTDSFTIKFKNLILLDSNYSDSSKRKVSWAQSFDNSELEFLSLLKDGIQGKKIRASYGVDSKHKGKISEDNILNIINTILTVITIIT